MKNKILFLFLLLLPAQLTFCQIIDKYDIVIGSTYSNQLWRNNTYSNVDGNQYYRVGLAILLSWEKKLSNLLAIKSELGFLQKGFKNNLIFTPIVPAIAMTDRDNVVLNNAVLNIGLKISPLSNELSPYALIAFQGDYLVSYRDIMLIRYQDGSRGHAYKDLIDKFNKFNLNGLIAIGVEYKETYFLELGFNPAITSSYNSDINIKENSWNLTVGCYFSKLLSK